MKNMINVMKLEDLLVSISPEREIVKPSFAEVVLTVRGDLPVGVTALIDYGGSCSKLLTAEVPRFVDPLLLLEYMEDAVRNGITRERSESITVNFEIRTEEGPVVESNILVFPEGKDPT